MLERNNQHTRTHARTHATQAGPTHLWMRMHELMSTAQSGTRSSDDAELVVVVSVGTRPAATGSRHSENWSTCVRQSLWQGWPAAAELNNALQLHEPAQQSPPSHAHACVL